MASSWTALLQCLADPLVEREVRAEALHRAVRSKKKCPADCTKNIKSLLQELIAMSSEARCSDLANQALQRLEEDGLQQTRRARPNFAKQTAQQNDADDSDVDWWIAFSIPDLDKQPPSKNENHGESPTVQEQPEVLAREDSQIDSFATVGGCLSPQPLAREGSQIDSFVTVGGCLSPQPLQSAHVDSQIDRSDSSSGLEELSFPQSAKRIKCQHHSSVQLNLHDDASEKTQRQKRRKHRKGWVRGMDCGSFFRRGRRGGMGVSGQLILCNVHANCAKMSLQVRKALREHFQSVRGTKSVSDCTFADSMTALLCGFPPTTVRNVVRHVDKNGLCKRPNLCGKRRRQKSQPSLCGKRRRQKSQPSSPARCLSPIPADACHPDQRVLPSLLAEVCQPNILANHKAVDIANDMIGGLGSPGFKNWLRICAFASSHGLPKSSLPAIAHTVVEAHGDVGSSYINRHFGQVFDGTMFKVCLRRTRLLVNQPLGGTGVPADTEFIGDGVTCGQYWGRSGVTLLLCGGIISVPHPPYAAPVFFSAESQGTDERAAATMARMSTMVRRGTALDMQTFMRTRVASDCGDGALVTGGPEARHPSTSAMNRLWTELAAVEDDNALWDGFHQFNVAGTTALNESTMGKRFIEMLKKAGVHGRARSREGIARKFGAGSWGKRSPRQSCVWPS